MILGYEQPVDIPVTSVYDKQMMSTYLSALQRDYEQGVKRLDDFMEKYGEFIGSASTYTDAYYKEGVGKLNSAYDTILNLGYDPVRSVEGRKMLHRAMLEVDRAKLAQIKRASDTYDAYNKAVAIAKAQGTYNQDMENAALTSAKLTPGSLDWNRLSPEVYIDPNSTFLDILKDAPNKTYNIKDSDGNVIANYQGLNEDDAKQIVSTYYNQWKDTPTGKYITSRQGFDKDSFIASMAKAGIRQDKRELDPVVAFNYQKERDTKDRKLDWYNAATSRMNAEQRGNEEYDDLFKAMDKKVGDHVQFDADKQQHYKINVDDKLKVKDGKYYIKESEASGVFYSGELRLMTWDANSRGKVNDNLYFVPAGRAIKKDGKYYQAGGLYIDRGDDVRELYDTVYIKIKKSTLK